MFNEIYEKVVELGRVMTIFPQGYNVTESATQLAMINHVIKSMGGDNLYYITDFDDMKIVLVSDAASPMTVIVADTWIYYKGKPTHLVAFKYDLENSTQAEKWLTITTIILSLTLDKVKAAMNNVIDGSASIMPVINTVNIYSTMIITIKVLSSFGATNEEILAHVRASYNDPVRENITMDTIESIETLFGDTYTVKDLLDDSMIWYILSNYEDFKDNYPGLDIQPAKYDDATELEDVDPYAELEEDIIPFRFVSGNNIYNAIASSGDLAEYVNDPDHYKILYIRTDDDGSGDWATFEDRRVVVNKGGSIIISSRCDLSPIMVSDCAAAKVHYIIVDNDLIPDDINGEILRSELSDKYNLGEDYHLTFEQAMNWVDTLPGDDNEAN